MSLGALKEDVEFIGRWLSLALDQEAEFISLHFLFIFVQDLSRKVKLKLNFEI